ncbi:uncharacterized protein G2W53_041255 [Senna tora]|uniref:Uncharacterized protein n=1 Tax=Senna tora TaxID=362788 RepID=A0A834W2Q6_9FABA|nr:uncharacterized protein G2W53_041255 [Senna tora]
MRKQEFTTARVNSFIAARNPLLTPVYPSEGAQTRKVLRKVEAKRTSKGNQGVPPIPLQEKLVNLDTLSQAPEQLSLQEERLPQVLRNGMSRVKLNKLASVSALSNGEAEKDDSAIVKTCWPLKQPQRSHALTSLHQTRINL